MNTLFFETLSSSWILYSFVGMLCLGISLVFYKLPSSRKDVDANGLTVWSGFFFLLFAVIFFLPHVQVSSKVVVMVALAQGIFFTLRTLLQMHGLKYAATNALFPTSSSTALLIVIAAGILFFGDSLSSLQQLGVALAVLVLFLFAFKGGKLSFSSFEAVKIWLGIVVLSAAGNLLNKVAADLGDIHTFQFFLYVFIFISGLVMLLVQKKGEAKKALSGKATFLGGLGIGIFGFFGAWALIIALGKGPVSVAQTINSSYVIVTALLSSLFFGEVITRKKAILIALGIVALILIRLGS